MNPCSVIWMCEPVKVSSKSTLLKLKIVIKKQSIIQMLVVISLHLDPLSKQYRHETFQIHVNNWYYSGPKSGYMFYLWTPLLYLYHITPSRLGKHESSICSVFAFSGCSRPGLQNPINLSANERLFPSAPDTNERRLSIIQSHNHGHVSMTLLTVRMCW